MRIGCGIQDELLSWDNVLERNCKARWCSGLLHVLITAWDWETGDSTLWRPGVDLEEFWIGACHALRCFIAACLKRMTNIYRFSRSIFYYAAWLFPEKGSIVGVQWGVSQFKKNPSILIVDMLEVPQSWSVMFCGRVPHIYIYTLVYLCIYISGSVKLCKILPPGLPGLQLSHELMGQMSAGKYWSLDKELLWNVFCSLKDTIGYYCFALI